MLAMTLTNRWKKFAMSCFRIKQATASWFAGRLNAYDFSNPKVRK